MKNQYDEKYNQKSYYWGKLPSAMCFKILKIMPPDRPIKLLDIGCGEGRNAVFLARNGYHVTAFDLSSIGVEKTKLLAKEANVKIDVFKADLNNYRLNKKFDILFSSGVLHYIPEELRKEIFNNYKEHTEDNGLNVFSVFVKKPFIEKAPDAEKTSQKWISGELLTYYQDWKIEYCTEEIFDCMSGGVPHKHVISRMVAKKIIDE